MQLIFIGSLVPDDSPFNGMAFSRAGNMFQMNYLSALGNAGLSPSLVLSQRPARAFPHSTRLLYLPSKSCLENGLLVNLLPFINIPILRPITIGLAVIINLIYWNWNHRGVQDKIVITFNLSEPPGLFTLIGAKLIGAKAIAHIADVNVPGETVDATIQRRIDFWLQSKLIPRFDGLTVVNDLIARDFAPKSSYLCVECGVSDEAINYALEHSNVSTRVNDHFVIVSAGSLNEVNGFLILLEAFSLLKGDKYRLRIAGRGPLEGLIRKAASRDSRIEFCGYLPFQEVMSLYTSADVLINMRITQRINTKYFFPSKTMEYLVSGTPVIMTHVAGMTRDYAQIAFLLKNETPQALAQMIEDVAVLDPMIRQAKGKAAQEYIQTHHTWALHGQQILDFLNTFIDDPNKSP